MTRKIALLLLSFGVLSACGADGEPVRPTADVAVAVSSNGNTRGAIGVSGRNTSIRIGL